MINYNWTIQGSPELVELIKEWERQTGKKSLINGNSKSMWYYWDEEADSFYYLSYYSADKVEVTIEQLRNHYLKPTTMEEKKEIIGYKLIKPEFEDAVKAIVSNIWWGQNAENNLKECGYHFAVSAGYESAEQTLRRSGVLDLWFEPVYKASFKVGDKVALTSETVYELTEEQQDQFLVKDIGSNYIGYILKSDLKLWRLATEEEIEKASVKTETLSIGNPKKEVIINSKGEILTKGYNFDIEELKALSKSFGESGHKIGGLSVRTEKLWIGCSSGTEVTKEHVEKIIYTYQKLNK